MIFVTERASGCSYIGVFQMEFVLQSVKIWRTTFLGYYVF